jgi:uncharacterized integral membrane protein
VAPGAAVPPAVLVGAVLVAVLAGAVVVVVAGVVAVGVPLVTAGALEMDTVLVWELPQPPSAPAAQARRPSATSARRGPNRLASIPVMVFAAGGALPRQRLRSNCTNMSAQPPPSAGKPAADAQQPKKHRGRGLDRASKREMSRAISLVVLAVVAIVFALLNLDDVEVHWAFGSGKAPLIVVIVISLLVGIVLTYFAERVSARRRRG